MRLETALWRAVSVYRVAALLYAAASLAFFLDTYRRPGLGLSVLGAMTVWTVAASYLYRARWRRRWPLLVAHLLLSVTALLASVAVLEPGRIAAGEPATCSSRRPATSW